MLFKKIYNFDNYYESQCDLNRKNGLELEK